jgi:hypothetical protein
MSSPVLLYSEDKSCAIPKGAEGGSLPPRETEIGAVHTNISTLGRILAELQSKRTKVAVTILAHTRQAKHTPNGQGKVMADWSESAAQMDFDASYPIEPRDLIAQAGCQATILRAVQRRLLPTIAPARSSNTLWRVQRCGSFRQHAAAQVSKSLREGGILPSSYHSPRAL